MGWLRRRHSDKEKKFLEADFRECFCNPTGYKVLSKILEILDFYCENLNEESVSKQNAAKEILSYFGTWEFGNQILITQKLLEVSSVRRDSEGT